MQHEVCSEVITTVRLITYESAHIVSICFCGDNTGNLSQKMYNIQYSIINCSHHLDF